MEKAKLLNLAQAIVSAYRKPNGTPELCDAIENLETELNKPRYEIHGRRWFATDGHTRHSVRIYKDGKELVCIPYAYGYGDDYLETALEWLEKNGHIPERVRHPNGSKPGGTLFVRETLGAVYSVIDVNRKKDL